MEYENAGANRGSGFLADPPPSSGGASQTVDYPAAGRWGERSSKILYHERGYVTFVFRCQEHLPPRGPTDIKPMHRIASRDRVRELANRQAGADQRGSSLAEREGQIADHGWKVVAGADGAGSALPQLPDRACKGRICAIVDRDLIHREIPMHCAANASSGNHG